MKNKSQHIEQFSLAANAKAGIFVANMQAENIEEHDISKPHRDNHCQLMLAISGNFKLNIDFKDVEFSESTLICVFPEQVHHIIEVNSSQGWIISFDTSVVNKELFQLIESRMNKPMPLNQASSLFHHMTTLMTLMEKVQLENRNKFMHKAVHSLLNGMLNLIIGEVIITSSSQNDKSSRGLMIKDTFNQLLKQHYKIWKRPAQYASALAISVAHLNDTIKSLTGSPVSIHIQEASILEAKRLLYFTNNSIKEIAYEVGYNESVYFGKLFKKITNTTPLEFRKQFRD